jgi:hypothetical protein
MGGVYNYINLHVYHYAGNNPVKLTDPDGRDASTALMGLAKTIFGIGEVAAGIGFMTTVTGGEAISGGLATPMAAFLGATGFGLFIDGLVQISFGIGEFSMGIADVERPDTPTSTGGIIGATIDRANGHDRTQGAGPAERAGDVINNVVVTVVDANSLIKGGSSTVNNAMNVASFINDARTTSDAIAGSQSQASTTRQPRAPLYTGVSSSMPGNQAYIYKNPTLGLMCQ